jgi:hypothetical protein
MPTNWPALPIEIAVVRSDSGNQRAATFVVALSTSGCPADMTTCPASTQPYDPGSTRRTSAPPAVSAEGQGRAEAPVGPAACRQGEQDVEQRVDRREVADGAVGDVQCPADLGRHRREAEPQQLRRRDQQRERDEHRPAGTGRTIHAADASQSRPGRGGAPPVDMT